MHLVDDDKAQVFEKLRPLGVVRKDALMQHVGIGHHDVPARAHRLACITGRITIKGISTHAEFAGGIQFRYFSDLILRQGPGRKEIQRLRLLREAACNTGKL